MTRFYFWLGIAALLSMSYLGWEVFPVARAMWRYENLQTAVILFAYLYFAYVINLILDTLKRGLDLQIAARRGGTEQ